MNSPTNDAATDLAPWVRVVLALVQGLLPALTAVVGALWIAWTYIENQKQAEVSRIEQATRENTARLLEARKPFLAEQLARYIETAQVAGKLVTTTDFAGSEWQTQLRRFEELYWTELSMVENETVKERMQQFSRQLLRIDANKSQPPNDNEVEKLRQDSYVLARALRRGIEATWDVNLSEGGK